jgi:hypothetical protein
VRLGDRGVKRFESGGSGTSREEAKKAKIGGPWSWRGTCGGAGVEPRLRTPALELQVACRQTFERQPRLPAEREPAAVQWRQPSSSVLLLVALVSQPVNDGMDEIPARSCPRPQQTGAEIVRPPIWRLRSACPSL